MLTCVAAGILEPFNLAERLLWQKRIREHRLTKPKNPAPEHKPNPPARETTDTMNALYIRITGVSITGNKLTKPYILVRELDFKIGDSLATFLNGKRGNFNDWIIGIELLGIWCFPIWPCSNIIGGVVFVNATTSDN
jgi:hypothetical protein